MARGFLSGILWGGLLGVGVSSAASVLAPPPMPPEVSDAAPGGVQAPERVDTASSGEQGSDADRTLVTGQIAPQAPPPDPDTLATLDPDALSTARQPQTGGASNLDIPAETASTGAVDVGTVQPVLPNPQALAPMEPQDEAELSISTEPAQPPAPVVNDIEGNFEAPDLPAAPAELDETAGGVPAEEAMEPAPAPDAAEAPAPEVAPQADTQVAETPQSASAEDAQVAALAPDAQVQPAAPPVTIVPSQEPEATELPQETAVPVVRPSIGTPATSLTDRDTGVVIRRPGSGTLSQIDDGEVAEAAGADGAEMEDDPRPVKRFAQDFTPDSDKPLMAIVLIDDGTSPVAGSAGIAALRSFPYPLSFAVDASLADAPDRMAVYRDAGFEVLAMVDLPDGAEPPDAETAFGAILPRMDQIVAVLEGTGVGLQSSREVADQVTSILAQSGHGLLTHDKGLNTMPKLARKAGVPADPVFRDFDSNGQSAQVIRRFLDQAAFKAGQEGAVVMLGRMRPDTVSALLLWGLQDRAGKVALAPISTVLLRAE